ncbi:MAG: ACT domain-containing protein, partial [Candidatus Binatia bacterium]
EQDGANPRPIKIEVSCVDKPGLLAAISAAITSADVNISRAQVQTFPGERALNIFEVMLRDSAQLNRVLRNVARVKGVFKVERARG